MRTGLFLVITMLSLSGFAAETSVANFYRTQQSLFPSGQAKVEDLEAKILRRDYEPWFRVTWNNKDFEIPGETVITDLQVTKTLVTKEFTELLQAPEEGSKKIGKVASKKTLQVMQTKAYWAEVLDVSQNIRGWAPLHNFEAPFSDPGVFITLTDAFLRKSASSTSEIVTTIPRMTRVNSLGIEKSQLKVHYQNHTGYIDLANLAGRGDFAMWAYHKNKGWLGISHRENGYLFTVNSLKLALEDFIAFNPYTDRGVISQKLTDEGPSIRSRVTIANSKAHRWVMSALEGHGPVWWRTEVIEGAKSAPYEKQITTEQLLKREVTSVAFAEKTQKGLASAKGIFRTDDGKTWTEISQFEGKNYPVNIHPEGMWFVGNYRSFDEGKSFETFIKWDKLAQKIQAGINKTPSHLRITSIESLSHSRIRILVDTGVQKIKMQAHVLSNEWFLVK
jgi:hypothetical protein